MMSWPDVASKLIHYLAGGAILGSVLYLTVLKMIDSSLFVGLASAAFSAIGVSNYTPRIAKIAALIAMVLFGGVSLSACGVQQNIDNAKASAAVTTTSPTGVVTTSVDPVKVLQNFTVNDLVVAQGMAAQATDDEASVRANCYAALIPFVQQLKLQIPGVTTSGVASGFEQLAELNSQVNGGIKKLIPKAVHVACAPVVLDAQQTILSIAVKLGGAIALPGIGGAIPGILQKLPLPISIP